MQMKETLYVHVGNYQYRYGVWLEFEAVCHVYHFRCGSGQMSLLLSP